jgi:hypothetical protein
MNKTLIRLCILWIVIMQSCSVSSDSRVRSEVATLLEVRLLDSVKTVHVAVQQLDPAHKHFFAYIKLEMGLSDYLQLMTQMTMTTVPKSGITPDYHIRQISWDFLLNNTEAANARSWWDPALVGSLPSTTYVRRTRNKRIIAKHENGSAYLVLEGNIP